MFEEIIMFPREVVSKFGSTEKKVAQDECHN
jgi:hypothetical protein